ncbi:MAG: DegT/DnrJ/EryC1/StrS family aminotransferase, partial [Flammeovirgaceae bacterium]|nr:DegT/DnrJ/EryC1/StrS family aminotransferase [Flammeovirgaceae bacterium]
MSEISCKIPFLDLKRQYQTIKKEILARFEEVCENTAFSGGKYVEEFEKKFAEYCQTNYALGVDNGTSALHLAMLALGIGQGDEVIVPANTFIATAWGVSYCNAIPVFVDCTPDTWEIDTSKIEEKITSKTKAIAGVHLYGQPFDIDAVKAICQKYNLFLIEDAAQAHGAYYKGKRVGGFGEMACFSFYPGKNLGAYGEAGGITTNNEKYYKHIQSLRNHGSVVRYYHDEIGYNMRMGGLEAVSLIVKLNYLDGWNNRRKQIAKRYQTEIKNPAIKMQHQPDFADSVYHLFVITTEKRDD